MKRILVFLLAALLAFSMISCGKSSSDAAGKKDKTADSKTGKKDDKDKKKDEEKKVVPDSVDNMFICLDKAIKKGHFTKAKALFTPGSLKKIKDPDSADFLGETLYGQIKYEVNNRFRFKTRKLKAKGKGLVRSVVWPSGKVSKVTVQKIGKYYKMNIMKSTGGDNLE